MRRTGDVLVNFIGVAIRGANAKTTTINGVTKKLVKPIPFAYDTLSIRYVTLTDCYFYHVIDNVRFSALELPTFTGRTYTKNVISKINERTYAVSCTFTVKPSEQGAITNDASYASSSSKNHVGKFTQISQMYNNELPDAAISAYYYLPNQAHSKVYPLIAYRNTVGLYIRPLDSDTLLTDATNTNTYTVVVSGVITFGTGM